MDPKLLESFLKLGIAGVTRADAEAFVAREDGALMARHMVEAHDMLDAESASHAATKKKLDEMTASMDAVQKVCDAMKAERRAMEADVPPGTGDKKDGVDEPWLSLVARWTAHRAKRLDLAKAHGVTVTDAMSNRDIEKAIVLKHDAKAVGRSVDFYDARCDGLAEDRTDAQKREDAATAHGAVPVFRVLEGGGRSDDLPPPIVDPIARHKIVKES